MRCLLELTRIAAMAAGEGVMVAPPNPGGPVSTRGECPGLCRDEASWRSDTLMPPERFVDGTTQIPERPGFGVT